MQVWKIIIISVFICGFAGCSANEQKKSDDPSNENQTKPSLGKTAQKDNENKQEKQGQQKAFSKQIAALRDEVNKSFTFNGKPIHPLLIHEFIGGPKYGSFVTAVDVTAAQGSKKYSFKDVKSGKNWAGIQIPIEDWKESYWHTWYGRMENGVHVIRTSYSGGGSGCFGDLLFVELKVDRAYKSDGTAYERLLMKKVLGFGLRDRDDAKVEVMKDRVVIGPYADRDHITTLIFSADKTNQGIPVIRKVKVKQVGDWHWEPRSMSVKSFSKMNIGFSLIEWARGQRSGYKVVSKKKNERVIELTEKTEFHGRQIRFIKFSLSFNDYMPLLEANLHADFYKTAEDLKNDTPTMTGSYFPAGPISLVDYPERFPTDKEINAAYNEIKDKFTYLGHPLHPGLFKRFLSTQSFAPVTVFIDYVESCAEFRSPDENVKVNGKKIRYYYSESDKSKWYEYERLHTLGDGLHILKTVHNDGKEISEHLVLVRFKVIKTYNYKAEPLSRVIMEVYGRYDIARNKGKDFGKDPAKWQNWWSENKDKVLKGEKK